MAKKKPLVSVLMPFYDDGKEQSRRYLIEAIESAMKQTFKDFEIVLVVAGKRNFSKRLARRYKKIRLFFQNSTGGYDSGLKAKIKGIASARNLGVKKSRGELIAFFDADDISLPQRLQVQVDFLSRNPDVGLVGSSMLMIDAEGKVIGQRRSFEKDSDIRRGFLQFNTISQPTVMARKKLILAAGGYSEKEIAEDFDLWVKMAKITRFCNLQKTLVKYRIHPASGTTRVKVPLYLGSLQVKLRAARELGLFPSLKDILVNIMQFISLFFPESLRRTTLEKIRSSVVVGK